MCLEFGTRLGHERGEILSLAGIGGSSTPLELSWTESILRGQNQQLAVIRANRREDGLPDCDSRLQSSSADP